MNKKEFLLWRRFNSRAVCILVKMCVLGAVFAVCLLNVWAHQVSNEKPATETTLSDKGQASLDSKANQVIQQASKYISGLKSFRTEIDMIMKIEAEGMKQEMTSKYSLALQKPNKFAMVLNSGMFGGTIVCDGKDVFSYTPMIKKYTKEKAPESLSNLKNLKTTGAMDLTFIAKFIIHENPYDLIMEEAKSGEYVGLEDLDGKKFHHLKLTADLDGEETDFDVWVNEDENPTIHKIVPDISKALAKSGEDMPGGFENMKVDVELVFKNWEVNVDLSDDTFSFTPPEGVELAGPPKPHPLLGKPAPLFKLELLEGGEFDLAQHKDKNIVILDFWATWCGPCKKVMPILEEIAKEYKDKGVVVVAVDLREEPEKIRSFLEEQGLHPTVALDKDGKVGSLYEAKSIPQTVIIGTDGSVQAVHVGSTATTKEALKKELDELLEGKKLTPVIKPVPRTRRTAEESEAIWTLQSRSIARELNLSEEDELKLAAAYKTTRKSQAEKISDIRKEIGFDPNASGLISEKSQELNASEKDKLETSIKEFLDDEKTATAVELMGSFSYMWDRMSSVLLGFKLEEEKLYQAVEHVNAYIIVLEEASKGVRTDPDSRAVLWERVDEQREKLTESLALILSKDQLDSWKKIYGR